MPSVYVKEQGAYLKKSGERVVIEKGGHVVADIPVSTVTNVSVFGNVQISTQALVMLMENGIDIAFFSYSGHFLGQAAADRSKNIFLRFSQYELYQNIDRRLSVAKKIVSNKIENQMSLIRLSRFEEDYSPEQILRQMEAIKDSLPDKSTSNEIMGVEGICSALYFQVYGRLFKSDIRFEKRNRRPPRDPVNVILSLGYTMLTKEVEAALESESFETHMGFLHGIRYGRRSLALDIVEEFRQPVIDRLVLRLFNKRMLVEMDFEKEGDAIVLTEGGFRKFFTAYEKWMKSPVSVRDERSPRSILRAQVSMLKNAVRNGNEYLPYAWEHGDVPDQL